MMLTAVHLTATVSNNKVFLKVTYRTFNGVLNMWYQSIDHFENLTKDFSSLFIVLVMLHTAFILCTVKNDHIKFYHMKLFHIFALLYLNE